VSRTRRFVGGIGYGYLSQAITTVVGLWMTPFLLARLGTERVGLWLIVGQLLSYLTLLDLGVIALLPREVAIASGTDADGGPMQEVSRVVARATRLLSWQLPVITIASVLLWYFLPARWSEISGPLALALVVFVLTYPLRIANASLEGLQELSFLGRVSLGAWGAGTLVTLLLVLAGFGLWSMTIGWAVTQVGMSVVWTWRLWARYRAVIPHGLGAMGDQPWRYLKKAMWGSISQLSTVLIYSTDLLIIGKVLGPAAVVPYSMTAKLVMVLQHQPHMLMRAALPGMAELRAVGDRAGVLRVALGLMVGMLVVSGCVAVVIMLINRAFVAWWVGPGMYLGEKMTALLLLVMLMRHWGLVMQQSNFAMGDERVGALVGLGEGIVTAAASLALTHYMGTIGVVLGALLAAVGLRVPFNLAEMSRRLGQPRSEVFRSIVPWGWRVALLLAIAAVAARVLPQTAAGQGRDPRVFAIISVAAAVMGLLYAATMYVIVRRSVLAPYLDRAVAYARRRIASIRARQAHG
jgi:O-antigen/teichoic acid export membrane protein